MLMRSHADLLNQNSRGVKRSRSPGTYEAPSPGLAGDEGMSWSILCSCVRSPWTCLMLHDQGSATRREDLGLMALSRKQIETPGNAENL